MLTRFSEKIKWLRLKKTPVILLEEEEEDEEDQNWQKRRRAHERDAEKQQRQQDRPEEEHARPERKPRRFFRRSDLIVSILLSGLFVFGLATSARVVGLGGNAVASATIPDTTCGKLLDVLQNNGFAAKAGKDGSSVTVYGDPNNDYQGGGDNAARSITLEQFVELLPPTTATPKKQFDYKQDVLFYDQGEGQICYRNHADPGGVTVQQEIERQLDMAFYPQALKTLPGPIYCKEFGRTGDYWDDLKDFFNHIDSQLYLGGPGMITIVDNRPTLLDNEHALIGKPPDFTSEPDMTGGVVGWTLDIKTAMLPYAANIQGMDYDGEAQKICVPGNWKTGDNNPQGSKYAQQAVLTWLTNLYNGKVATAPEDKIAEMATSMLNTMVKFIGDGIITTWKTILDWGANLLFPYVTPANMTYRLEVVDLGHQLVLAIVGSLASLALVIGAYRLLGRRYLGESGTELLDTLGQVCIGLVAATFCWPLLQMLIDKESELTRSVTLFLYQNTYGKISDQDWMSKIFTMGGAIADYTAGGGQGLGMLLVLVVEVVIAVLLMLQDLARIALLDLMLIFSPLWIFCLFFKPWRKIGSVGLGFFGVTLLMQVVQVITLDLGQILLLKLPFLGSSSSDSLPPLITLVLAAMFYYIAFRIPGMLYQLFAGTNFAGFMVTNKGLKQGTRSAIEGARHPIKSIIG